VVRANLPQLGKVVARKRMRPEKLATKEDDQMNTLPITALILSRSKELGLSRNALVNRAGYTNTSKGLRRLEQLCEGQFRSTRGLIQALPSVLEVSPDVVAKAIEDTERQFADAKEAAYRKSFVPHAIIITERNTPQPIFMAAMIGVDRLIRVDFDLTANPTTFVQQALRGVQAKLASWKIGEIPTFGKAKGIIVTTRRIMPLSLTSAEIPCGFLITHIGPDRRAFHSRVALPR
jgi:hypothetical protein